MSIYFPVLVGALGYFVDLFDLFLFSVVRIPSLASLGVPKEAALDVGVFLLDVQMTGLLLGGLVWGVLADKTGRRNALFASILLYSVANLLNATVHSVSAYAVLRFFAGFGLAGELGAAITLVSENLPTRLRGYGTTLVASVGLLGAMAAAFVGERVPWRIAFVVGGLVGLVLLGLRVKLAESNLYVDLATQPIKRGDLRMLFLSWERLKKYGSCVLAGVPIYFVVGVLITFSPEFGKVLSIQGTVLASRAIFYSYLGAAAGDLFSGLMSQRMKNRKVVIGISLWANFAVIAAYLLAQGTTLTYFYTLCGILGFTTGYWTVLVTLAAEQFGTNLRATVATSVPNWVRGSVVPLSLAFKWLKEPLGLVHTAFWIALVITTVAFLSLRYLKESFAWSLDYVEH